MLLVVTTDFGKKSNLFQWSLFGDTSDNNQYKLINMHRFLIALAAAVLVGCAGTEQRVAAGSDSDRPVSVQARTEVPLANATPLADNDKLVETDLQAGLADELFQVRSRYSVTSGELVRSVGSAYREGEAIPTQLARQSVEHAVRLSTPGYLGAPLRVGFDQRETSVLTLSGQHRQESTRAHLAWDPDPVSLHLEWTPPRRVAVVGDPLDCTLEGRMRMPTETISMGMESALDLSQSDCLVRAPDRGVDELPMQARGLVWSWGDGLDSSVHMNRVELLAPTYGMVEGASGHELGLRRRHSFFGWQMAADIAMRQAEAGQRVDAATDERSRWSVDLQLTRQLHTFALTARWMQAKDPLWFVPEADPVGRESLSLLLDFSSWLGRIMPGMDAGMRASWRHTEDAEGRDDNHFRWDFSLSW
jgi:hypothetical protein